MPPPRHIQVTFSGIFGTVAQAVEEWSMGVAMIASPVSGYRRVDLVTFAGLARAKWQASSANQVSNKTVLTRTRVALVGAAGRVEKDALGAFIQGDDVTAVPGVQPVPLLPTQLTIACSLHSVAAGPTGRGRYFLPGPALNNASFADNGILTAATQTGVLNNHKALIDGLNAATQDANAFPAEAGLIGRVCIASGGSATLAIPPSLRPVVRVSVGRVVDTQRRRRASLDEMPTSAVIA